MSSNDIINGGFFDSRENESSSYDGYFMYKQGVNVKFMSGKNVRQYPLFRLLPAFDPENPDPETSVAPWIYDDVQTTSEWLSGAYIVKCAGGTRGKYLNFASRKTIGEQCSYEKLYRFASRNKDWDYLTKSVGRPGAPGYKPAVLPYIRQTVYINIFDPDQPERGAQIGEFGISSAKSLYDRNTGIMWQLNPRFTDEVNALNYMDQFVYGDLTDPEAGLVLRAELQPDGKGYIVKPDTDGRGRVYSTKIDTSVLAARVDLSNVENFLNIPTDEELITLLSEILTQENAAGVPETALLQEIFGDVRIISSEPEEYEDESEPVSEPVAEPVERTVGFTRPAPVKRTAAPTVPAVQAAPAAPAVPAASPAPATTVHPVRRAVKNGTASMQPSQQWGTSPAERAVRTYEPVPGIPGEDIPQETFDFLRSKQ